MKILFNKVFPLGYIIFYVTIMFGRPEAHFPVEIQKLGFCPIFISFLNFECLDDLRKF